MEKLKGVLTGLERVELYHRYGDYLEMEYARLVDAGHKEQVPIGIKYCTDMANALEREEGDANATSAVDRDADMWDKDLHKKVRLHVAISDGRRSTERGSFKSTLRGILSSTRA